MTRQATLTAIQNKPEVSVLIIGGGVNGIGLYRDLALQDVDVLLVDKADFCSGASAASSHMAHGGLRYLENGEFRLVKEALKERNLLLQNAPHYVHPLPTTIPIFSIFSGMLNAPLKFFGLRDKPGERGALIIRVGLAMYDLFSAMSGYRTMPLARMDRRKQALQKRPKLNPDIRFTATYYDAWMPYPERICIEMLLDTEAMAPHAHSVNYMSAVGADADAVTLRDELTGEEYTVKPQIVVNAAGPWIDLANQNMGRNSEFIGGTKGSHLVVDHHELHAATQGHEMFFENDDGRIVLFFPLGERVLMGTTDIPVESPDDVYCTDDEKQYILEMVRKVFPDIQVDESHIVFTFSGVRPLPRSDAASAGQISRDHSIKIMEPGYGVNFPIYALVGGKWTTFRAFAEQITEKILHRMHRRRKISTEHMAIGGGQGYPKSEIDQEQWLNAVQNRTGLDIGHLTMLFERYGTYAADVASFMTAADDKPLTTRPDYTQREIIFIAEREKVTHLDDFILRRSMLGMGGYTNCALLEEIAGILAPVLGWSQEECEAEVKRTSEIFSRQHRINLQ